MSADFDSFSWNDAIRLLPAGNLDPLPPCKLSYDLIWNSMKGGKAEILLAQEPAEEHPDLQAVSIEAQTVGMARVMYPLDVTHRAFIHPKTLRPVQTLTVQKKGKNATSYKSSFTSEGPITDTEAYEKGMLEKQGEKKFPCAEAFDIVTAVFYIRDVADQCEDQIQIPILALNEGFLLNLCLAGKESLTVLKEESSVLKLQIAVSQPHKDAKDHMERVQSAYIYLSDDALRIPVEMRVETEMGTVAVKLSGFQLFE